MEVYDTMAPALVDPPHPPHTHSTHVGLGWAPPFYGVCAAQAWVGGPC